MGTYETSPSTLPTRLFPPKRTVFHYQTLWESSCIHVFGKYIRTEQKKREVCQNRVSTHLPTSSITNKREIYVKENSFIRLTALPRKYSQSKTRLWHLSAAGNNYGISQDSPLHTLPKSVYEPSGLPMKESFPLRSHLHKRLPC